MLGPRCWKVNFLEYQLLTWTSPNAAWDIFQGFIASASLVRVHSGSATYERNVEQHVSPLRTKAPSMKKTAWTSPKAAWDFFHGFIACGMQRSFEAPLRTNYIGVSGHRRCKSSKSALRERHVWNKRWAACVSTAHQSATYEKKRLAFVLVLVSRVESYGKHIISIWADILQRQLWFVCINTADSNKKASEVFSQIAHPDPIDTLRVKKRFSDFRKERKAKLVGHIMRADTPDALRAETVQSDSVSRVGYGTRKVSPD